VLTVEAAGGSKAGVSIRQQNTLDKHVLTKGQTDTFVQGLVKAVVTGNVPLSFFENEHLIQACRSLGVQLPSRKVVSTKWLPQLAEQANTATRETLSDVDYVDASSDGWL
jgi:hypothetical protein